MAVIGVGALGRHHARIVSQMPGVEFVAVADQNQVQGEKVAQATNVKWVADYRTLIDEVDAVTIAVPTGAHFRVASDFLENGIHSLVEKPLTADLAEATQLVQIAEQTGATLQVGHVERFNPAFQLLRSRCDSPRYIRAERLSPFSFRSTDIGVVHDMMIHDLDLILSLVPSPVSRVDAIGFRLMGSHEDAVQARLIFENGCLADLSASRIHPTTRRISTVWTATQCLHADFGAREVTTFSPSERLRQGLSPVDLARQPGADIEQLKQAVFGSLIQVQQDVPENRDALTAEIAEFVEAIQSGSTPTVTGSIALESLTVAERILGVLDTQQVASEMPLGDFALRAA
jgi:predicted dehydrogenase